MQPEDIRLSNELKKCTEAKGFIIKEIQEISKKLISKRAEVEEIKEQEAKLLEQFHELVPTNHDSYDGILAFYERITKKRRRPEKVKQEDAEGDEDGEEAEEEETYSWETAEEEAEESEEKYEKNSDTELSKQIDKLIQEAKKRKVSETSEMHFLKFLNKRQEPL